MYGKKREFGNRGGSKAPPTRGTPLESISQMPESNYNDGDWPIRNTWKTGSKVQVYSSSADKWFEGQIIRIFYDEEGEWLEVQYAVGSALRLKQIPRDDEEAIRPSPADSTPTAHSHTHNNNYTIQNNNNNNNNNNNCYNSSVSNSTNNNNKNYNKNNNNNTNNSQVGWQYKPSGNTHVSFNNMHMTGNNSNNRDDNSVSPLSPSNMTFSQYSNNITQQQAAQQQQQDSRFHSSKIDSMKVITQADLDEQIRRSWVRGAVVEVFSRGRKKWLRGLVMRVFHDDEGEWLEVRYGKNLVKEIPRDSQDIRPLRAKLRPKYKFTKEHEGKITGIWEDVDLEATRHLDFPLVQSVFRALNISISDKELHMVFNWIDQEERGAITCDEFIQWMKDGVETVEQRDLQHKIYKFIDDTVKGSIEMSQQLKENEKKKLQAIYRKNYDKDMSSAAKFEMSNQFNPAPELPPSSSSANGYKNGNEYWRKKDDNNNNNNSKQNNTNKKAKKPPLSQSQTGTMTNNTNTSVSNQFDNDNERYDFNNMEPLKEAKTVIYRNGRFMSIPVNEINELIDKADAHHAGGADDDENKLLAALTPQQRILHRAMFGDITDYSQLPGNQESETTQDNNNQQQNQQQHGYEDGKDQQEDYWEDGLGGGGYGAYGGYDGNYYGYDEFDYEDDEYNNEQNRQQLELLMMQEDLMGDLEFSGNENNDYWDTYGSPQNYWGSNDGFYEYDENNNNGQNPTDISGNNNNNNRQNNNNDNNNMSFGKLADQVSNDNNNNKQRRGSLKPSSIETKLQVDSDVINKTDREVTINKLKEVGIMDKYMVASVKDQEDEYESKLSNPYLKQPNNTYLQQQLDNVQVYMKEKVKKAGIDGLRMSDLSAVVHKKFPKFDKKSYLPSKKARFADFVMLCPGLIIVEMDDSSGTGKQDRIAVTEEHALKINLKSKMQFVLAMLFDKSKLTNEMKVIMNKKDLHGRLKQRRLSVGEKLLSANDFATRLQSLNFKLTDLELDELFWAIAGPNALMLSQNMVGRYFAGLVDHLPDPVQPHLVDNIPKVISMARLRYKKEPLWDNYIIVGTIARWNNISYIRVTDRRTRKKNFDMIVIPRTKSVHGGSKEEVQRSFHSQCHILNKLQYITIAKKIHHGIDIYNYCCMIKTPHLRSFPEMLKSAKQRNIEYSEYFIAQVVGSVLESVCFCHKHDVVNLNLNVDSLGFDAHLRPVLLDFSRSFFLGKDERIKRFYSVVSSTPTELALMMGSDSPITPMEITGDILRKADAWRVGVLLYTLVTGMLPYPASSLNNFITGILTNPPVIPIDQINCSQGLKNLLKQLLDQTFFNRIDCTSALRDPWLKNRTKTKLGNKNNEDVYNKIQELCRIEQARGWISAYTHGGYNIEKQFERDHKYFVRMDPTGNRKKLRLNKLETFIQDRMGYCLYQAKQIINEFGKKLQQSSSSSDNNSDNNNNNDNNDNNDNNSNNGNNMGDPVISWKEFRNTYVELKNKIGKDETLQLTNAIFKGLDIEGNGWVPSSMLKSLFYDIGLELEKITEILDSMAKMTFEQVYKNLQIAFEEGFNIHDLLSVDHVVVGYG